MRPPTRAVHPEHLIEAGIISSPTTPEGAFRRARALIRAGAYKRARTLLYPHVRSAPDDLRPRIAELLGLCAARVGGDWRGLLESARSGFERLGDRAGVARIHAQAGEQLLLVGDFDAADHAFKQAREHFTSLDMKTRAALAECYRGRVQLRSGQVRVALRYVDRTLRELMPLARPREEGMVRLDRALILAHLGDAEGSARELLSAERMLAASGHPSDRVQTRLVRAESLLILGDADRAARGLRRLLSDVVDIEEVGARAWVHLLMGRSLLGGRHYSKARRHLIRAKHLYQRILARHGICACELLLAQVELHLGLAVRRRIDEMRSAPMDRWPALAAELKVVEAEARAPKEPEAARLLLMDARRFAMASGNRSLVQAVDTALRINHLMAADDLTPIMARPAGHAVVTGTSGHGAIPAGGLQRIEDESTEVDEAVARTIRRRLVRPFGERIRSVSNPSARLVSRSGARRVPRVAAQSVVRSLESVPPTAREALMRGEATRNERRPPILPKRMSVPTPEAFAANQVTAP